MAEKSISPWDAALNQTIAEDLAENTFKEFGVQELTAPLRESIDIFGVKRDVQAHGCRILARRLNQEPMNISARKWLPPNWRSDDAHLYVLALMLWGLTNGGLAAPNYWETTDQVAGLIADMMNWNPAYVMALLENPSDPRKASEEVFICADELANAEDPEGAAALLLESLEIAMTNRDWCD